MLRLGEGMSCRTRFLTWYTGAYNARIKDLNRGILAPKRVTTMTQAAHYQADFSEAEAAAGAVDCDFEGAAQVLSDFVGARSEWIPAWSATPN